MLPSVWAQVDGLRRAVGRSLDVIGLGPVPTPARIVGVTPTFDVLAYGDSRRVAEHPVLLLIPAPIKRAYIWDLAPRISVVRRCLERGLGVYLLRWKEPDAEGASGLVDYADRFIAAAVDTIGEDAGVRRVALGGHSLGGTFAAIFATLHPDLVRSLVLLEAPLSFGRDAGGAFAAAIRASPPAAAIADHGTVPGTLLDVASLGAAPDVFQWERWLDRVRSSLDPAALRTNYRVERWLLDELALPSRLFDDVVNSLYREDRLMRGTLTIDERPARPQAVTAPIVAVVDPRSRIVPRASIVPFIEATRSSDTLVLEYEGDTGVSLQHVGVLVGRDAHRRLWPVILDWIAAR